MVLLRFHIICSYILGAFIGCILLFQSTEIKYFVHLNLLLFFSLFHSAVQAARKQNVLKIFFLLYVPFQKTNISLWGLPFWCRFYSQVFTLLNLKLWKQYLTVFSGFLPSSKKHIKIMSKIKKKKKKVNWTS